MIFWGKYTPPSIQTQIQMCIAKIKVGSKVVKAGSTVKQDRKWLKHDRP